MMPERPPGHLAELLGLDRRRFLEAAAGSLGALLVAACNSKGPQKAHALLTLAERKNEGLERLLLRHTVMDHAPRGAKLAGNGFPSYLSSIGFRSKESTCESPPRRKMKMTFLALGVK